MAEDTQRGLQTQAPWLENPSLPRRMLRWLVRGEKLASTLLLITIMGLIVAQVVARYVFQRPLFWSDELARYCYVWLSFVAGVAVIAGRSDVRIDLINRYLKPKAQKAVDILSNLIVVFSCVLLVQGSLQILENTAKMRSPALGMPMVYLYVVVWGCFILMAFHVLVNIFLTLIGREEPADEAGAE